MKHKSSAFKSLLVIIAVIFFSFVTLVAGAQEVKADIERGTCGEQVDWFLTDYGYLKIYGQGKMTDYNPGSGGTDTTWNSNNWGHFIKAVSIGEGVTSIGDYAFFNVSGMRTINIPKTVTTIGESAFANCGNLRSITIPNSVTSIGVGAFDNSGITSVKIPSKMKAIGNGAFVGCHSLESVTIPDSVTHIDEQAFGFCSSLKSINIPNKVTTINMWAFQGCESLESITIPDSVTSIGGGAFADCTGLKSINIPKSVTYIGKGAFSGCSNLKHVYYGGSEADLKNVNIGKENDSLNKATWHYGIYSISYDANGGVGAPAVQEKNINVSVKLSTVKPAIEYEITFDANGGNVSTESKTVQGTFQKWNTKKDGKGTSYNPGATYTPNASATLYAQWYAEAGTLPTPTLSGKTFSGWFTDVNGGKQIINSSKITNSITLYAHWTDSSDPYNFGDETYSFENYLDFTKFGQCFGMSITSSGFHNNLLNLESFCEDASTPLYSLSRTQSLEDLIMYYSHIQGSYCVGSCVAGGYWYYNSYGEGKDRVFKYNIDSDWEQVVNYVKDHKWDNTGLLQVNFTKKGNGSHAVNFLRYENVNGEDRIYIYDNNFPEQECYFYKNILGNIKQTPEATFSGALDGICLNNSQIYFRLADSYDATRAVYVPDGLAYVKGCSYTLMSGDTSGQNYVMYEIPEDMDQITIIPNEDYAKFIYLDKEYSFEEITEDTVGELVLATADEGGVVTDEFFEIYEEEPEQLLFNDVQDQSAWYYNTVYEIASTFNEQGHPLMSGYSNGSGNFGPADPLARQDFAVILYRLANEPDIDPMDNPFADTDPNGYYYTCVCWAKANSVISGYNDGRFGVGDKITREQVATILYRFAKDYMDIDTSAALEAGDLNKYIDGAEVSDWAKEALTWATGAGVITGKSQGTEVAARGDAARAEIGAMVLRFITYMDQQGANR